MAAATESKKATDPLCDICEEQASHQCGDCKVSFCHTCDANTHRAGSGKETHNRTALHPPPPKDDDDDDDDDNAPPPPPPSGDDVPPPPPPAK